MPVLIEMHDIPRVVGFAWMGSHMMLAESNLFQAFVVRQHRYIVHHGASELITHSGRPYHRMG